MFKKIANFFREVRTEMSRVTWPTRDELKGSTTVVILVTLAFSVFIFIVDNILEYLFKLLYGL
jgi:preprotein translocase subunit SecE